MNKIEITEQKLWGMMFDMWFNAKQIHNPHHCSSIITDKIREHQANNDDVLDVVIPSAYLVDIDNEATIVVAECISDAMDKAEATGSKNYQMAYSKSLPILH